MESLAARCEFSRAKAPTEAPSKLRPRSSGIPSSTARMWSFRLKYSHSEGVEADQRVAQALAKPRKAYFELPMCPNLYPNTYANPSHSLDSINFDPGPNSIVGQFLPQTLVPAIGHACQG
jgi:hypothetical protein